MITLTKRQETFCQAVAKGETQSGAYRLAYSTAGMQPSTVVEAASRVAAKSNVSARIAELRSVVAARTDMSIIAHVGRLAQLRDAAMQANNHSAAVAAEKCIGQVAGHYVQRVELSGSVFTELTADDKAMLIEAMSAEAARRKLGAPVAQPVSDAVVKTPDTK